MVLYSCRIQYYLQYVTLHRMSGNKVNVCTWHVLACSHANGMTYLPCRYAHKNYWFWKACCSHCSYLANMVEICFNNMVDFFFFYNTLSSFVSLTGKLISSKPLYFVTCVFQLLNCENGVYNYVQNISRSSVQVKSCNKKGDIYSKSWLFPSGFSQSARCIDELKSRTT